MDLTAYKPVLADGVREVGDLPDFSVRHGGAKRNWLL
jgi:hypothetical protein